MCTYPMLYSLYLLYAKHIQLAANVPVQVDLLREYTCNHFVQLYNMHLVNRCFIVEIGFNMRLR